MDDKELENKLCSYNSKGEEIPDPTPVALPVGFERPVPLGERIRALVHSEVLRRGLEEVEAETFDDADDFDIPDDPIDPSTPYEESFDPSRPGAIAREQELRAGAVQDISSDRKRKSRELADKTRDFLHRSKQKGKEPKAKAGKADDPEEVEQE